MNPNKITSRNAPFLQIYLQNGQNPIPIQKASKKPLIQWKEYQQKTYDKEFPEDCNIATICGIHSGEFVLDFDFDDIPEFAKKWINETLTIKSGKRGYHFHFRGDEKIPLSTRLKNDKNQFIDVLGVGKYAKLCANPPLHDMTTYKIHAIILIWIKSIQNVVKNYLDQTIDISTTSTFHAGRNFIRMSLWNYAKNFLQ